MVNPAYIHALIINEPIYEHAYTAYTQIIGASQIHVCELIETSLQIWLTNIVHAQLKYIYATTMLLLMLGNPSQKQ